MRAKFFRPYNAKENSRKKDADVLSPAYFRRCRHSCLLLVSSLACIVACVFADSSYSKLNGGGGGTFPLIEVITTQREGVVHMDVDTMAFNWDLSGLVTWEVLVYEVN